MAKTLIVPGFRLKGFGVILDSNVDGMVVWRSFMRELERGTHFSNGASRELRVEYGDGFGREEVQD